ncbi:MFS transporter [Aeromicrobium sp. CF4.19]|uniref:MFS transporter n=1 Tax=Aeromicrobium sp. CF4.19 TaxID=3373082 RepID=UPI003EE7B095
MTSTTPAPSTPREKPRSGLLVVGICFLTIVFDGYDLVVYGATVPSILAYQEWDVSPEQAGSIGSYALIGMLIGTLVAGALTDLLGRRKVLIACVAWFSVGMALTALSPNVETFAVLRFLSGLGLGGVVPTAIALTVEYSPAHRRQFNNALMYSGYSVGGILAAVAGLALLPEASFTVLYAVGALPLIVILPVALIWLPESAAWLASKGRMEEARALADRFGLTLDETPREEADRPGLRNSLGVLFSQQYRSQTVLFAAASFCGLLLVYGLNTWLPNIMTEAGYDLGNSLTFLLVLNAGAIIGALGASRVADRVGSRPVTTAAFAAAVVSILGLSVDLGTPLLMALVAVAGLGSVGTQILINGFVATHYPDNSRATALGWSLGVGRLGAILGPTLGGLVVGSALGVDWNFYLFAAVAAVGAVAISLVPRSRKI